MFLFTKEMAKLLKQLRDKANLSQTEVGIRIGLKPKNAAKYLSNLEAGKITNPTLRTVLNYLRACGASWVEFFRQLDTIDFKMRHEKMISQLPPEASQRKIQRDAMRYEIGVEFPSKEKEEFDFTRLKKRIKDKVLVLLTKNQVEENRINSYQRFASEFFDFLAALNKPGQKMVVEKYQRAGLARHLIFKIRKIIFSVIGAEIKRIESKKPLPTAKQERMAIGFTKYRIRMERIEAEVHKVLCELGVESGMGRFALYKDFARECYGALKKYYARNPELLNKTIDEIIKRWQKQGLKEEVLLKVKERTFLVYRNPNIKIG